jgi:hypothetical protein
MDRLEHIGLKNIADLKSYNMSRVGNRLMHLMEFANGGTLEVTFLIVGPNTAKVEVFKGQNISLQRSGNDLTIGQSLPNLAGTCAVDAGTTASSTTPEKTSNALPTIKL